jgi:hypothetical protein
MITESPIASDSLLLSSLPVLSIAVIETRFPLLVRFARRRNFVIQVVNSVASSFGIAKDIGRRTVPVSCQTNAPDPVGWIIISEDILARTLT